MQSNDSSEFATSDLLIRGKLPLRKVSKVKFCTVLLATIGVILLPQVVSMILNIPLPSFLNAFYFLLFIVFSLPLDILNNFGVSGVIKNNGNCGWGWCGPTVIGYLMLAVFWMTTLSLIVRCYSYFQSSENP